MSVSWEIAKLHAIQLKALGREPQAQWGQSMLTVIIINYPTMLPSLWPCLFCSSLNHTVLLSIARTSDYTHTTYVGPLSHAGNEIPGLTLGTEPGVHMLVLCSTTDPACQSLRFFLINGSITVSKSDTPVQIPTCYKPADWQFSDVEVR